MKALSLGKLGRAALKWDGPPDGTYFADTGLLTFLVIEGGENLFSFGTMKDFLICPG